MKCASLKTPQKSKENLRFLSFGHSFVGAIVYAYHDLGMISPKLNVNLCADNQCLFLCRCWMNVLCAEDFLSVFYKTHKRFALSFTKTFRPENCNASDSSYIAMMIIKNTLFCILFEYIYVKTSSVVLSEDEYPSSLISHYFYYYLTLLPSLLLLSGLQYFL